MSRIGRNPITFDTTTKATLAEGVLSLEGAKGSLSLPIAPEVQVEIAENVITISPKSDSKRAKVLWGTTRSNIQNMVQGVSQGFTRELHINGVGYRAAVKGQDLVLNLGYSHEVVFPIPQGIKIVCPKPTEVKIEGFDKQLVGQTAAKIRGFRKPEPYKGKGVKYAEETIFRKEGKKK